MALDFDINQLPEGAKAAMNGVPFLANMVSTVETPYYTKLLQTVITFMVVGMVSWSASIVIGNKENSEQIAAQLALLNQQLLYMQENILSNKAEIQTIKSATKDRVYRPEWERKYQEQDARLLHLERAVK